MIRGGYKIIDLKGKLLTENVGMVYEGIYDAIEECQKPILISGLVTGLREYKDFWVEYLEGSGAEYRLFFHTIDGDVAYLTVTDTDVVTFKIL